MVPTKGKYAYVSKGKGATTTKSGSVPKVKEKREKSSDTEDSSDEAVFLPDLKMIDITKQMPRFSSILTRSEENGVTMEDLDPLQMELETLLNTTVVRSLTLQREIAGMTERLSKSNQSLLKGPPSPGKRAKLEDRSPKKLKDGNRSRDTNTPPLLKPVKVKSISKAQPTEVDMEEVPLIETVRTTSTKNDIPNKFWASIEPYCAAFTEDDLKFLEELIVAHGDDEEFLKIPPLGRHYTLRWAEDDLQQEQREGSRFGERKRSANVPFSSDDAQRLLESATKPSGEPNATSTPLCGPLTQRLISALMEENIVTSLQDSMETGVQDENYEVANSKTSLNGAQAAALERRIRQELEEQGILTADEANATQADDEILTELRRCQGELRALSQHNLQQLKKLHRLAKDEIKRQEVRKKLQAADSEILDTYRKMSAARQKKRPVTKKEKEQAWKALRDRESIVKQIDTG